MYIYMYIATLTHKLTTYPYMYIYICNTDLYIIMYTASKYFLKEN